MRSSKLLTAHAKAECDLEHPVLHGQVAGSRLDTVHRLTFAPVPKLLLEASIASRELQHRVRNDEAVQRPKQRSLPIPSSPPIVTQPPVPRPRLPPRTRALAPSRNPLPHTNIHPDRRPEILLAHALPAGVVRGNEERRGEELRGRGGGNGDGCGGGNRVEGEDPLACVYLDVGDRGARVDATDVEVDERRAEAEDGDVGSGDEAFQEPEVDHCADKLGRERRGSRSHGRKISDSKVGTTKLVATDADGGCSDEACLELAIDVHHARVRDSGAHSFLKT